MDVGYPTDNINDMIRAVKGMTWAGRDLCSMVELGYVIMHGDFSDDNLTDELPPYKPSQFCNVPYRYLNYSLGNSLDDNSEDIVHYFRVALDFIINYIKEFWYKILQSFNNAFWEDTWMRRELIGFMEENKDKYPEQYLEMKLS